jgi:glycosyltransferase involved in cell wall biosynthesis
MSSAKVRILSVLTNLIIGGDESRLLNFSRALDRSRFEHTVLSLTPPDHQGISPFGLMKPHFDRYGIPVEDLGEEPRSHRKLTHRGLSLLWGDARSFSRLVRRLAQYLRDHKIDIVDARQNHATLVGLIAGRLAGVGAVVTTSYGPDEFWSSPARYAVAQLVFSQVDATISDSIYGIEALQRWLGHHPRRAVVIANGIFPLTPEKTRMEVRHFFDLPADPNVRVFGQVSRLVPYKGHRVLLRAARQVLKDQPASAFLLCGYASHPEYLEVLRQDATRLGIGDRVRIAGYPGPIADVWGTIDVHVHASLRDSSPIAVHESMALGLPAVVTDVGGIRELVEDGKTALVVPPSDSQALANALLRILREPDLAKSLGQSALQRFCEHFQAITMARALENLFSTLVAEGHRDDMRRAA